MAELIKYVRASTDRGECDCGSCLDRGTHPEPAGHVADLVFFKVAVVGKPSAERFVKLTAEHKGEFTDCDPFDGAEHHYVELGAWIGDQGLAMQYMGLGALLGVFKLLTPYTIFGPTHEAELRDGLAVELAGNGLMAIRAAS